MTEFQVSLRDKNNNEITSSTIIAESLTEAFTKAKSWALQLKSEKLSGLETRSVVGIFISVESEGRGSYRDIKCI